MTDSANHVNFYENLEEAHRRLLATVVMYDGSPYIVQAITAHRPDEVFRVYLMPLGYEQDMAKPDSLPNFSQHNRQSPALGMYLDKWMEANPKQDALIRKRMDSKHFNKFRPFPLGMVVRGKHTYYVERTPQRRMEQGLTQAAIVETSVSLMPQEEGPRSSRYGVVHLYSKELADCILGKYLPAEEALSNLLDPEVENVSLPFNRQFAFIRLSLIHI